LTPSKTTGAALASLLGGVGRKVITKIISSEHEKGGNQVAAGAGGRKKDNASNPSLGDVE